MKTFNIEITLPDEVADELDSGGMQSVRVIQLLAALLSSVRDRTNAQQMSAVVREYPAEELGLLLIDIDSVLEKTLPLIKTGVGVAFAAQGMLQGLTAENGEGRLVEWAKNGRAEWYAQRELKKSLAQNFGEDLRKDLGL